MSLSEIFDHGAVIPWANFRFNNIAIDGTNNSSVTAPATGGPTGTISRLAAKGTVRLTSTGTVNVYTFTLPVTVANPNGAFNVKFVTLFKGGPVGSTNNGIYQETLSYAVTTAGSTTASTIFSNVGMGSAIGTFTNATVNQVVTSGVNSLTFGVRNTTASQTTDVMWYAQVDYFIDNL